ncbi:MAG TPA: ROK family transcriptional regulator [Oligoflexus sp.]|uniref:ROK family transcriptional regulator n=1 Tax=Oligoflexus sp. TaxID=1971216 RepID=UPI002D2F0887|nr:ROK family transcriptional regulator [Oligoflexus sp.]HYX33391.1 ROK family transcriptional regulator [Oligoflexus sp.]
METVDSSHMRTMNSTTLLRMIWQEQEISRADISRMTGMSRSSVSAIVAELLERDLVSEQGVRHSSSGRRPTMLSFHSNAYSIIGVDMGATHVAFALMNLKGMIRESRFRLCPVQSEPQQTMQLIIDTIQSMKDAADHDNCPVIGIGLGLPCPVHPDEQQSPIHEGILPAWVGLNPRSLLRERFGLPVLFDNDANLGALAELWWAKEPERNNLAFIKLGTGVGAGLILNGRIHRGRFGLAGELGHMLVHLQPNSGMQNLNDVLGSVSLMKRAHELGRQHPQSLLSGCNLTLQRWLEAALDKDPVAEQLFNEVIFTLGSTVASLLVMLDLDAIVLSGNLSAAGDMVLHRIRDVVRQHLIWKDLHTIPLRWSQLGEHHIALGAATMILEKAMNDLSWFPLKTIIKPDWDREGDVSHASPH